MLQPPQGRWPSPLATCRYLAVSESSGHEGKGQTWSWDVPHRPEVSLGISLLQECRKQHILWASAGFSAHADFQIGFYKYFLIDPNVVLKMEFYFFFQLIFFKNLLCTWGDFIVQLSYYLLHRKICLWMAPLFQQLAFCCTESFLSEQPLIHSATPLYILWLAIPKKKKIFSFLFLSVLQLL